MTREDVFDLQSKTDFESVIRKLFLTSRQDKIARLRFEEGLHNQEIADRLNLSIAVVKKEFRAIKRKLDRL